MSNAEVQQHQTTARENEKKWSKPVLAAGWSAIPSVLLERQQALGLSPTDLNILLQIIRHWWKKDSLPYPSKQTIAECIGIDKRTVQRRIEQLEKDGLIQRESRFSASGGGQQSNYYNLSGLVEALKPLAKEAVAEKTQRRAERSARRTRKGRGVSPATLAKIGPK